MNEEGKPENGSIPPRVTIKVPGQSGDMMGLSGAPAKKKTARIPLDQASGDAGMLMGEGSVSKTIRLAPALTGQVAVAPLPSIGKALTGTFVYDEAKRQTSRIPLEAAMQPAVSPGSQSASPAGIPSVASTIPKTIKVKRPSISLSPAASPMQAESPVMAPAPVISASGTSAEKNQTARVDVAPETVPEAQPTQKKTIKIRRDGGEAKPSVEARNVTIARLDSSSAAVTSEGGQVAAPHGAFIGAAALAFLVLCFMVYVLAAQAFPNLGWSV